MNLNNTLVYGLSNEEELATIQSRDILHFSEKEYVFLSDGQESLSILNELNIALAINSHRELLIGNDRLMIIDGEKNLNLNYLSEEGNPISFSHTLPFNYTIKLPEVNGTISLVKIYIVHLYPYLINARTIELHILYTIALEFQSEAQEDLKYEKLIENSNAPDSEEEVLGEDFFEEVIPPSSNDKQDIINDKKDQEDNLHKNELEAWPPSPPFNRLNYIDPESETM